MADREELTCPDGTSLQDATSALIKSLRRGRELEAYYWARQIEVRFHKYVWRRLSACATEDVGLADPLAAVVVEANRRAYERDRAESSAPTPDRSYLVVVVLYLARAAKSREADDLLNAAEYLAEFGWAARVPDEALDLHTAAGRDRLPRSARFRHWVEEASRVENRRGPYDWRLWVLRWAAQRGLVQRRVRPAARGPLGGSGAAPLRRGRLHGGTVRVDPDRPRVPGRGAVRRRRGRPALAVTDRTLDLRERSQVRLTMTCPDRVEE